MRPTRITVNPAAIRHNLSVIKQGAPAAKVLAVIKANAFGHGLMTAAQALGDADAWGVCCLSEGLRLRVAYPNQPIVIMEGALSLEECRLAYQHDLILVVHCQYQLAFLRELVLDKPLHLWLKVDTGMHRLGLPLSDVDAVWQFLADTPTQGAFKLTDHVVLMSHLATADLAENVFTQQQIARFDAIAACYPVETSLANSAATLQWPTTCNGWIRPGILLYGISPLAGQVGAQLGLEPAMRLRSAVMAINAVPAYELVGYGPHFMTRRASRIAAVPIGYGDGYPRQLPNGAPVWVKGHIVPLVGRVSMDRITLDVTDFPDITVGSEVILWGPELPVEQVAAAANTIAYELVSQIRERGRNYTEYDAHAG